MIDILSMIVIGVVAVVVMVVNGMYSYIRREEIMNKHINDTSTSEGNFYNHKDSETFKATEMKGTIKLEPEDVNFVDSREELTSKYVIDLSKRIINELGIDWAEHWKVKDTYLIPDEDFYKIDVTVERIDNVQQKENL